jgi:hypothetical protein
MAMSSWSVGFRRSLDGIGVPDFQRIYCYERALSALDGLGTLAGQCRVDRAAIINLDAG